jgi:hypothetical protein
MRIHSVIEWYNSTRPTNLDVIAVFASTADKIESSGKYSAPPFPIVADPDEKLYQLYRVETSLIGALNPRQIPGMVKAIQGGFARGGRSEPSHVTKMPAEFLIDRAGRLWATHYAAHAGDSLPLERVEAFLGE